MQKTVTLTHTRYVTFPSGVQRSIRRMMLTDRQHDVLLGIAHGQTYREIADELGIGLETVKEHAKAMRDRLGARTGSEAVAVAFQKGILA